MSDEERRMIRRIAAEAVRTTGGGNPWRTYELAKHRALELLGGKSPRVRDRAIRQIAAVLGI